MQLILNADDLGYSPAVNAAILDLHARGRLSSASLIVNLPHSEAAMAAAAERPDLALGVHLNLTRGAPCTPAERIPSLVARDGRFHPTPALFARAAAGRVALGEVRRELGAQIRRAMGAGLAVTHLDSHSHWHILPHLDRLMRELAVEYEIPAVRLADPRRTLMPNPLWLAAVRRTPVTAEGARRSDYLFSLNRWMNGGGEVAPALTGARVERLLREPGLTAEFVVHPGRADDPDFPPDTLPAARREWEYRFVQSAPFDAWLGAIGARLN